MDSSTHTPQKIAPDGGFGWFLVFFMAISQSMIIGFEKTKTLFYQQLLFHFGESATLTTWCISLGDTLRFMLGPLAGMLCNRFGHRAIGVLGGLITSLGFIFTGQVDSLYWTYFTDAIFKNTGMALLVVARMSIVNMYFDKNRGKANAVVFVLTSVGGLYMAPLSTFLYEEYGFSGTLLIFGAIAMNGVAPAMLYRPLQAVVKPQKSDNAKIKKENLNEKDLYNLKKPNTHAGEKSSKMSNSGNGKAMSTMDIQNIGEDNDISNEITESTHLNPEGESQSFPGDQPHVPTEKKRKHQLRKRILRVTGWDVLSNPRMIAFCLLLTSTNYIMGTSGTVVAEFWKQNGFSIGDITLILAISNGLEIFSRAASGPLFDHKYVRTKRSILLGVTGIILGLTGAWLPLTVGIYFTMAIYILHQFFLGMIMTQWATVMSDFVPRDRITSGVATTRFFQGFGSFFGPLIAGVIKDYTGFYHLAFYTSGSQMVINSIIYIIIILKTRSWTVSKAESIVKVL